MSTTMKSFYLSYKGYIGQVELDAEAGILFGKVVGLEYNLTLQGKTVKEVTQAFHGFITFQGKTVKEVTQAFHDSVDAYLAFCKDLGEDAEKPLVTTITITVNGQQYHSQVEPRLLLVHFLREVLDLTGTHIGCDTSQCGACIVMINGDAVKSCTVLAVQANGCEVTTIEGLAPEGGLHPIQEAFWEMHGLQCGFCTPGMIMAAYELLKNNPNPTEAEIRNALNGNICRCTGYQNIVRAIQYAAQLMRATADVLSFKESNRAW